MNVIVMPVRDPAVHAADRIVAELSASLDAERARAPSVEVWLRVVALVSAGVARDYGVEREVFAELMDPAECRAWEALTSALNTWPGPGPTVARAWKRLALAGTDEERESAREELRRLGVDPSG